VIIKPNKILIKEFVITKIDLPKIDFSITCSKGTYIRTIANDFGKKLNSGATLIALKRIGSGDFNLTDSKSVEEWIDTIYACD